MRPPPLGRVPPALLLCSALLLVPPVCSAELEPRLRQALAGAKELAESDPASSLQTIETVLRKAPAFGQAHFDRGLLLWKLDRIPEAVASLDSAIQHEPSSAEFLDERGVAAGTIGDDVMAEHFFRRAVDVDGGYVRSRSNLAYALMQLKRGKEAQAELQGCMRIDPQNQLCADRLRQLEPELAAGRGNEGAGQVRTRVLPPPSPPRQGWAVDDDGWFDEDAEEAPLGPFESPWLHVRRVAQLQRRLPPPPPPSPPYHPVRDAVAELPVSEAMAALSISDIENLGAIFHLMRSAESYDNPANKDLLRRNFDLTSFSTAGAGSAGQQAMRKPYATGIAVELISHRLTPAELSRVADPVSSRGEGLSDRSLSEIVGRLDRWGVVVLPSVIPEQLCALAERSILQSLVSPDHGIHKFMFFVSKLMNFVFKTMDFALKMLDFVL